MGPGVSTDSAMILATAENLVRGRGLIDYTGAELTQFPPLYSLILAAGSLMLRQDVFVVGWLLNALVFAAVVWFSGLYLYDAFADQPSLAYFGAFMVLSSTSLIEISANIASDPLFMLIVIFFLMSATAYLRNADPRYAVLAAALTVIGCFQRYAGLALVITGGLLAAYSQRAHIWRAAGTAVAFGAITGAPIVAWGFLHNAPVNGTIFGARLPSVATGNFSAGAEKILYWFVPYRLISSVGPVTLLLLIAAVLATFILLAGAKAFLRELGKPPILPNVVFLFVYFSVLVFDISYYELKGLKTDRVHIIALTSLLMFLGTVGSQILRAAEARLGSSLVLWASILLFLGWSVYPISKSFEYVSRSMLSGDISSYNSINKGDIRSSALANTLRSLDMSGRRVYSNGTDTAWFVLRTQVYAIPTLRSSDRSAELKTRFKDWPGVGGAGYIVWLNAEAYKTSYATPAELGEIANVGRISGDDNGVVYSVEPR